MKRYHLLIKGIVQGVGFRPFVYNLARSMKLNGWVNNTSEGVHIEIETDRKGLDAFLERLQSEKPPRAEIVSIDVKELEPVGFSDFQIRESERKEGEFVLISPDIATCQDCLNELLDPKDRRFRYPFINCTNCGPRFTIIEDIPYDRPKTTMKKFTMCPACQAEYDDPSNRRFHAQPNACAVCGPHLMFVASKEVFDEIRLSPAASLSSLEPEKLADFELPSSKDLYMVENEEALQAAEKLLLKGKIVALKGLGGFHLACDATSDSAVKELRERKRRPSKPFAIMVVDVNAAGELVELTEQEVEALTSPQAPIVLCRKKENTDISHWVAPELKEHGVMLPSTPVHHLLLRDVSKPLIMTSGNLSEEPIASGNSEALERLSGIADGFLLHNRDIYSKYDDSVLKFVDGYRMMIRRARSFAPYPLPFPFKDAPSILAAGPELKCTFCLTRENYAFVSQHLGDLEDELTLAHYERTIELYKRLFRITPEVFACDMHPDYLATRYAEENHGELPLYRIQHHHAHIASVLAEHGRNEPVIGFAFDGTGYGTDGTVWGGEVLIADLREFRRAAHLRQFYLPGGESAIKKPCRTAVSVLMSLFDDIPVPVDVDDNELVLLKNMVKTGFRSPLTSSMGRLFDAVAAIVGIGSEATYEGELAIKLEAASAYLEDWYSFELIEGNPMIIDYKKVIEELIHDLQKNTDIRIIGGRFHAGLAKMMIEIAEIIRDREKINTVAFSGGVFQNSLLTRHILELFPQKGFEVLLHRELPPNDGCISYGQAAVAAKLAVE